MKNWQIKLYRFLQGRNGIDDLYKFLFKLYIGVFILDIFFNSFLFIYLETLLIFLLFYRMLSKNISKRRRENQIFLGIKEHIVSYFRFRKRKWKDRNHHLYKRCPKCKHTLMLPLKKGRHTVKCPECGNRFSVVCHRNEKIKVEVIKKK